MKLRMWRSSGRHGTRRERAAAVVEFAVVLPLLLTILFGIIEYGYIFMVRQTLQHAAREGSRIAVLQTSVPPYSAAATRIDEIMGAANLSGFTRGIAEGANQIVTVDVSVPYSQVSLLGGFFGIEDHDIIGSCSMRKEGSAPSGS